MRDINALHPRLQQKVFSLIKLCEKNGLKIGIGECLRTAAEQDALYAQGRTKPGKRVTNAMGSTYSSQHQWGIAFDFYRNDGKGAYNNEGGFFEKAGALAKSLGLGWGGDWSSIKDMPHLYLPDWGSTTAELKRIYGTPASFIQSWIKFPVFETDRTYKTTQACYLRNSVRSSDRVFYADLSEAWKKRCRNRQGYAVLRKGSAFRLVQTKNSRAGVFGQMQSGYWVPLMYKGKARVIQS